MTANTTESPTETDRAAGTLLGLACGDALGRPVEFRSQTRIAEEYGTLTEMVGGGTHGKPPGTVTDDTELALCIAQSLRTHAAFEPSDVANRFVTWHDSGPFDAGLMTVDAIQQLQTGQDWHSAGKRVWEQRPEGQNAGNGSVMRCAPYAIAFADRPSKLLHVSRVSSRLTHADPRCTYGCAILNRTLAGILTEENAPLETALKAVGNDAPGELRSALEAIPDGISPAELQSTGYVVHTLQSALYHGLTAEDPQTAIANAVNMGQDTDTVGAVAGAIAGTRFGADALPDSWVETLRVESAPHGRGTGQREWVEDWVGESLPEMLRKFAEETTARRDGQGFGIANEIERSEGVRQHD